MTIKEYVTEQKTQLKELVSKKQPVRLYIIQVGDNPSSNSYIKGKLLDCAEVGIEAELVRLTESTTTEDLVSMVYNVSRSSYYSGVIVQLPLPEHIDVKKVQAAISVIRDVDGFNKDSRFTPCTPLGVVNYLKDNGLRLEGFSAVVIGRSDIVGKPLAKLLTDLNCTVTLAHSKTPVSALKRHIHNADIVFTAIDKIEYFDMSFAEAFEGVSTVIDIGLGKNADGKLKGNLNSELVKHLKYRGSHVISGVGGVGLLTRLQLLKNTVEAKY